MSTIAKIERALAIVTESDTKHDWPRHDNDPEVNFLVDQMIHGWDESSFQGLYIAEVNEAQKAGL
jgi:hypothetical protein